MRLILTSVLLLTLTGCGSTDHQRRAIVFRQHELEQIWSTPQQTAIDARFHETDEVFRAVFSALPRVSKVYMTEGYYYFRASLLDREISGNFRVRHQGNTTRPVVNFAYFDVDNPRSYRTKLLRDDNAGISVRSLTRDRVEVRSDGITRIFVDLTADARALDPDIKLEANERFITGVMDESGVRFMLVFNTATSYFYYLLATPSRHADVWNHIADIGSYRVLLGQRSKFVLLDSLEHERTLLIGVSAAQIRRNTYFDGPFDQVPPDLDIDDELRLAYPYVEHGSGIDTHGNFLDREDVRVAISPYQTYEDVNGFVDQIRRVLATDSSFSHVHQQLCYEPKRNFDPDTSIHQPMMRNWPANHFATVSYSWGKTHKADRRDGQPGDEMQDNP